MIPAIFGVHVIRSHSRLRVCDRVHVGDRKHEAASKVLQKVEKMLEKGVPLNDVLSLMGLSQEKFEKIKIVVRG